MQSTQYQPTATPPRPVRFRRPLVILALAALLGIIAFAVFDEGGEEPQTPPEAPPSQLKQPPSGVITELPSTYRDVPAEPPPPPPAAPVSPAPEPTPPPPAPPPVRQVPVVPPAATPPAQTPPKRETTPPKWLFTEPSEGKPPFGKPRETTAAQQAAAQQTIKPAPWVKPADARLVLYPDQVIPAITEQNVNSDLPGTLRFLVTQNVVDTQGGNHVLIPQFTKGVAQMEGAIKEFQERIPFRVKSLRFPDGTYLPFDAQVGDRSGANALPGDVDRHIPEKVLAILGSALLSVGARIPFGSPDGYNPNLAQEFANDFSSGVNQAGQQIVSKYLNRPNTITQKAAFPITIQFLEPLSFQQAPVRTTK
jgi:type IV secretory pathway VirB10-like protein